jgi:hypothetical protein
MRVTLDFEVRNSGSGAFGPNRPTQIVLARLVTTKTLEWWFKTNYSSIPILFQPFVPYASVSAALVQPDWSRDRRG